MSKQSELEKRIKALEDEIAALKARPPQIIYYYTYPQYFPQPYIPPVYPIITWAVPPQSIYQTYAGYQGGIGQTQTYTIGYNAQ